MDYEVLVIGSGPGGYHAAIRAAQLGKKTACVEQEYVGGVCLNVGCIPTKALLHVAEDLREAKHAKSYGIDFGEPKVDLKKLEAWKSGVVQKLTGGVRSLLKGNKVDLIEGRATLKDPHTVQVGDRSVTAEKIIVATGSEPIEIPGFETDGERIVNSTGALLVSEVPKRFLAIGGSAIGLEFSDIYHALGSDVTVVELMDEIVPTADRDAAKELRKSFEKRGIKILTSTKALNQKKTADGIEVTLERGGERETLVVDKILVAVGRKPRGTGLGLEEVGVTVERGFVPTNAHMQTNVPHIYAIGDVTKPPLLAHKAMKEGIVAAEHAAGKPAAYDTIVPAVVYTSPELASVGMTEQEAKDAGHKVRVGVFPLAASGRAMTLGVSEGLVKVIGDEETDLLLGFHMVGPAAGDMVAEAALAIEMGATLEDISLTQHAHPTIAESFMEAAEAAHGMAIHVANKRRR
ncbi:dihydrolipoyl dehydrogenase [Truepera radiovictrix]|uniref:Dihydrolipoyl dehydrogenase n=1 Tax=Truepera radiovictrix (strain DSM 17093 / CIP 108686 / LMG 22925 / RQ-24) TaxID=649638 RepID=D7CRE3_TRURR|nr:dihydrolipoyl dehydrogenase [Truepera radiovictrix]ADI15231.1 dihydrolipoamide dehydrogenase [Truepera radiovictrix DSM 17093]WMT56216.1 dihydrolipoyl dehydrogenase [Truepera radiovictrix]